MQQYIKDWLKSRGLTQFDFIECEFPWCWMQANDCHHITRSMRAKRKHNKDWSDLVFLCRHHHNWIHNNNTPENIEFLLAIAKKKIIM